VKALKKVGFEIINLGGNKPHRLDEMISLIEKHTGKKAKIVNKPFHKADMMATWANTDKAALLLDWQPKVGLDEGIKQCVEWWRNRG